MLCSSSKAQSNSLTLAHLSLGSNLGDRWALLCTALDLIEERVGAISTLATFIETAPWGFDSNALFLNTAVAVLTSLSPEQLLQETQQIERLLGRNYKRAIGESYRDRPIDIDILFYGNVIIDQPLLQIPHPLLHKRNFVLNPLLLIAPNLEHPLLKETVASLQHKLSLI